MQLRRKKRSDLAGRHSHHLVLFFFFQAEDGIRDYKVTGVQTCALPICPTTQSAPAGSAVGSPPSVIVHDGSGNPVSGVTVTFAPAAGSGSVTGGNRNSAA